MKVLKLTLIVLLSCITLGTAQNIEQSWQFDAIEKNGDALFNINTEQDSLSLNAGEFYYSLEAKNNLVASGDYILQNNLLVFYYNQPTDTIRRYKITELTDSTLVFTEKGVNYKFVPKTAEIETKGDK